MDRVRHMPGQTRVSIDDATSADAACYCIETDRWRKLPAMEQARKSHSSCSQDTWVYVFCGTDEYNDLTNTIERL